MVMHDSFTEPMAEMEQFLQATDQLAVATRAGDLTKVCQALELHPTLLEQRFGFREDSVHLIHLAAGFNRYTVLCELLARGCDVNERDISHRTPLQVIEDYAPS